MMNGADPYFLIPCLLLIGSAISMCIYHWLLYVQYHDRQIRKYCFYLFSISLYLLLDIYARSYPEYFSTNADMVVTAVNFIAILGYASFIMETVITWKKQYKALFTSWRIVSVISVLYIVFAFASWLLSVEHDKVFTQAITQGVRMLFIIVGAWAIARFLPLLNDRFMRWIKWGAFIYLFFMALVMIAMMMPGHKMMGLAPMHFVYLGTFFDVVFFSLAMSYKIKDSFYKVTDVRNRLSRDLHDDIGATLTSISFLSEVARQPNQHEEVKTKALDKIGVYSREMIEGMSDIVWAINPQNDRLSRITDRMKNFAQTLLSAKNISFHFESDEELNAIALNMPQRKNLFLIFKEAVNNAAKYSECCNLAVSIHKKEQTIWMQVKDDGKGFDPVTHINGNGISNMQQRAKEINGILELASENGSGTSIDLLFSITQNA